MEISVNEVVSQREPNVKLSWALQYTQRHCHCNQLESRASHSSRPRSFLSSNAEQEQGKDWREDSKKIRMRTTSASRQLYFLCVLQLGLNGNIPDRISIDDFLYVADPMVILKNDLQILEVSSVGVEITSDLVVTQSVKRSHCDSCSGIEEEGEESVLRTSHEHSAMKCLFNTDLQEHYSV